MRVLMLTQFFTPEIGATQTRMHSFAAGLASRGHEVTVVCEVPNHPQGVIRPEFRGRLVRRLRFDGFETWYVWVHTSEVKSTATRLSFYGSYVASAAPLIAMLPRPDVVFASSPPLPVAVAGAFASVRHRAPWILDVRDLWPEFPVAVGELSNPRVIELVARLARRMYRHAAMVTTVTEPFAEAIRAVIPADNVRLLPNGTTRLWVDGASLAPDRAAVGLPEDRFIWTFAGNLGAGQGLDAAVEAAARLDESYLLLLLGDGPARAQLQERAARLAPGRVMFRDQVPPAEALVHLRASDALLVSLASDPALADFVPSKLYDFCAVARPVVLSAAGEPARLASAADAAFVVEPGSGDAIADAVERLRREPMLAERLSEAGRTFGAANLRDVQVERLEGLLDEVCR